MLIIISIYILNIGANLWKMTLKILLICLPILCAIGAIIAYFKVININNDAIKFKKEYSNNINK